MAKMRVAQVTRPKGPFEIVVSMFTQHWPTTTAPPRNARNDIGRIAIHPEYIRAPRGGGASEYKPNGPRTSPVVASVSGRLKCESCCLFPAS